MKKNLILIITLMLSLNISARVFMTSDFANKNITQYFAKNKSTGPAPYTIFIGCNFTNSILDGLVIDNVTFIGCKFPGTSFKGSSLIGSSFVSDKTFGEIIFDSNTNFDDSDLRSANMSTVNPKTILLLKQTLHNAKTTMIKLRNK